MNKRKYLTKEKIKTYLLFKKEATTRETFIELLKSIYDDGVLDGKLQAYDEVSNKLTIMEKTNQEIEENENLYQIKTINNIRGIEKNKK